MALPQPDRISCVVPAHVWHKPEQTLLYQLVEQYWPEFQRRLSETGRFFATAHNALFNDRLTGIYSHSMLFDTGCAVHARSAFANRCDGRCYRSAPAHF